LITEPQFLYRLKPFTSYKFRVKATNDIGDSEFSEESESLTTLQAGQCHSLLGSLALGPWLLPGYWAFWERRGLKMRGHRPAGPCSPRRFGPEAAFARGLGPQTQPGILLYSFSDVPSATRERKRVPVQSILISPVALRDRVEGL
jgi:hypothetical protein